MSNSNSSSSTQAPRPTLKLKAGARRSPTPGASAGSDTSPNANTSPSRITPNQVSAQAHHGRSSMPDGKTSGKAGAHWSDEYKRRMQADMDALASR
jgi:hypothetical protein